MKKKLVSTIVICLTFLLLLKNTQAHTPSSMELNYNFDTQILHVKVLHSVADPNTHYIAELLLYVNDVWEDNRLFFNQNTTSYLEIDIPIAAVYDDIIKVNAVCSIAGDITDQIVVQEETTTTTNAQSLLLVGVSLLALVMVFIIKRK